VSQILKVLELAQQHGMSQMQIGRGRVEARLHSQRTAFAGTQDDALAKILLANQFGKTLADIGKLLFNGGWHGILIVAATRRPVLVS